MCLCNLCVAAQTLIPPYLGISAGEMMVTYLGNEEFCHYVTVGRAVATVNAAEKFCGSGDVVVSPSAWVHCVGLPLEVELQDDGKHRKVGAHLLVSQLMVIAHLLVSQLVVSPHLPVSLLVVGAHLLVSSLVVGWWRRDCCCAG